MHDDYRFALNISHFTKHKKQMCDYKRKAFTLRMIPKNNDCEKLYTNICVVCSWHEKHTNVWFNISKTHKQEDFGVDLPKYLKCNGSSIYVDNLENLEPNLTSIKNIVSFVYNKFIKDEEFLDDIGISEKDHIILGNNASKIPVDVLDFSHFLARIEDKESELHPTVIFCGKKCTLVGKLTEEQKEVVQKYTELVANDMLTREDYIKIDNYYEYDHASGVIFLFFLDDQ